jgi:hypothetical protein
MDVSRDRLENRILELMGLAEELEAEIKEKEQNLGEKTDQFAELKISREQEMEKLAAALAELPQQREMLLQEIPGDLVQRYQSARGRMGSRPLARVDKQVCSGCRVGISATVMREIKKGDRLIQCESCGRILHWEEE